MHNSPSKNGASGCSVVKQLQSEAYLLCSFLKLLDEHAYVLKATTIFFACIGQSSLKLSHCHLSEHKSSLEVQMHSQPQLIQLQLCFLNRGLLFAFHTDLFKCRLLLSLLFNFHTVKLFIDLTYFKKYQFSHLDHSLKQVLLSWEVCNVLLLLSTFLSLW